MKRRELEFDQEEMESPAYQLYLAMKEFFDHMALEGPTFIDSHNVKTEFIRTPSGEVKVDFSTKDHNLIGVEAKITPAGISVFSTPDVLSWEFWLSPLMLHEVFQMLERVIWWVYQETQNNDPVDFEYSYDSDHMGDYLVFKVQCTDYLS